MEGRGIMIVPRQRALAKPGLLGGRSMSQLADIEEFMESGHFLTLIYHFSLILCSSLFGILK